MMTGSYLAAVQLHSTCMVFSAAAVRRGCDAPKRWHVDSVQGAVEIGYVEGSTR